MRKEEIRNQSKIGGNQESKYNRRKSQSAQGRKFISGGFNKYQEDSINIRRIQSI